MPLKTPLHDSCLKKGALCTVCSSKVKRGEVKDWEVDVIREVLAAIEKLGVQETLRYESSAIAGATLYILIEGDSVKGLEEELSKSIKLPHVSRVKIIYYKGGEKELLEKLYGQQILSINKIYDPDGSVLIYVGVSKPDPGADKLASVLLKARVKSERVQEAGREKRPTVTRKADVKSVLGKLFG